MKTKTLKKIEKEKLSKIKGDFDFIELENQKDELTFTYEDLINFQKNKKLQSESLLNCIMQFCEENEFDVVEIGEAIKKDKKFSQIFKHDLLKNHEAVFNFDSKTPSISEWL